MLSYPYNINTNILNPNYAKVSTKAHELSSLNEVKGLVFFKSYASHFPDAQKAFKDITRRNPFYMAMTELRIARNNYLDWGYRKRLAHEAMECLRWGLKLR